jgi:hypothetical protein
MGSHGQLVRDADGGFSLQNGLAGARVATDGPDGFLAALDQFSLAPSCDQDASSACPP